MSKGGILVKKDKKENKSRVQSHGNDIISFQDVHVLNKKVMTSFLINIILIEAQEKVRQIAKIVQNKAVLDKEAPLDNVNRLKKNDFRASKETYVHKILTLLVYRSFVINIKKDIRLKDDVIIKAH